MRGQVPAVAGFPRGALGEHVAPSMARNCNAVYSALSLRLHKELEKEMLAIAKPRRRYVSGQGAGISHSCLPALHAFLLRSVQKLPESTDTIAANTNTISISMTPNNAIPINSTPTDHPHTNPAQPFA